MNTLIYINWTVDPTLIEIGPLTIRWYGLFFACAFLSGYQIVSKFFKEDGHPEKWMDSLLIYTMVGTILGARLGHVFFYDWEYYSQNLGEILMIWKGGLASHGAAIGIITAMILYSMRVTKKSALWILDRVVIVVALGGVFIRIGNLMNHEIIGEPATVPWAFIFNRIDDLPRHPTQIYEALCYLVIFVILYLSYYKTKLRFTVGRIFGLFLIFLWTVRFVIEFLKENQVAFEEGMALNMGQWLSIPFVLLGFYFLLRPSKPKLNAVKE